MSDPYRLYYWPSIQGRGEFVRLILENAGAAYVDVARRPKSEGGGVEALFGLLREEPIFAVPALVAGDLVIAQSALICSFLGRRHGLAPEGEAGRLHADQLQLTIADVVDEAHDTHHPLGAGLYYEDQREAAAIRGRAFAGERIGKLLGFFERALARGGGGALVGEAISFVDISLMQLLLGLEYAFPRGFARATEKTPKILALRDRVAARPRLAAYLASPRRIPFNEDGIFRRYPELDLE
jgi:glutathione S-transferase